MAEATIGKYRLEAMLGKGGMGVVYRAWDTVLERRVAIKLMLAGKDFPDELQSRFSREARSAARLQHPNIVAVYDLGEDRGRPYIAMEYVEGRDLFQVIAKREFVPFERKLDWMIQVCRGLHYAHANGIVHRDVKPQNIRIGQDGTPKIMDFGLARLGTSELTQTGQIMGTPHYMSPEQVRGLKELDGRSDLFSVGVILYQLFSGRKPFDSDNLTTVMFQIVAERHRPMGDLVRGCPGELGRIVDRCLAKDPGERYASCEELAQVLVAFRNGLGAERRELEARVEAFDEALVKARSSHPEPAAADPSLFAPPTVSGDPQDFGNLLLRLTQLEEKLERIRDLPGPEPETICTPTPSPSVAPPAAAAVAPATPAPAPPPSGLAPTPPSVAQRPPRPAAPAAEDTRPTLATATPAAPAPRGRPTWVIAVAAAVAALALAGGGYLALRQRPAAPPAAPATGTLVLDVSPWAEVEAVVRVASGEDVPVERASTPYVVELPAGRYRVTVSNPVLHSSDTIEVTVTAGAVARAHRLLPDFRVEQEVSAILGEDGR